MSDRDEPRPPQGQKPVKPMPRLWKSPPEEGEDESPKNSNDGAAKKSAKKGKSTAAGSTGKSLGGKTQGAKKPGEVSEKGEKKVLLEETPTFDTIESRQRVRLIVGGTVVSIVLLLGWTVYRVFLYDPGPQTIPGDDAMQTFAPPDGKSSLDQEARFMYNRAREEDKQKRTELAIDMLEKIIKEYKGTQTARDAQAALDRREQNLPLFSDRPTVRAEPEKAEPKSTPPARTVVDAVPEKPKAAAGEATLVLPSNPSEAVIAPPAARQQLAMAKTGVTPRPLPAGFRPAAELGVNESGWPLAIVGNRDGGPMVLIPGGTFTMGSNEGQPVEAPAHQVRLSAYYIDQHEVTNEQFRTFLAETRYKGQPPGKWLTDSKARAEDPKLPIVMVNARDARAFADWAGKQLPTEAQWEFAARTTESRRFPWGDTPLESSRTRTYGEIKPVMTFQEDLSPYGVFDMAGNVEEWTKDWYDSKYFRSVADRIVDNPTGPSTRPKSTQLVVKGGSKTFSVSYRQGVPLEKRLSHLGFRCVLEIGARSAPPAGNPAAPSPGQPGSRPGQSNVPF
jgi:sulfatase modifying factor 1